MEKQCDDTPYGGGSGMLLKPDILAKSIDKNIQKGERIFYLSPKGKKFDQRLAQDLSKEKSFSLICGHFEGVDERVLSTRNIEEISIGDYVLSGGETAALVVLDSVLRLLSILNIQNLKFGRKNQYQMSYYQGIIAKLKTGVYLNLRL